MKLLKTIRAILKKLFPVNEASLNHKSIEEHKNEMMLRYYHLGHGMNF